MFRLHCELLRLSPPLAVAAAAASALWPPPEFISCCSRRSRSWSRSRCRHLPPKCQNISAAHSPELWYPSYGSNYIPGSGIHILIHLAHGLWRFSVFIVFISERRSILMLLWLQTPPPLLLSPLFRFALRSLALILHFYRRLVYFICLAAFADAKRLPDLISLPTSHTQTHIHTHTRSLSLTLAISCSACVDCAATALVVLRMRRGQKELQTTSNVNTSSSSSSDRPHQARHTTTTTQPFPFAACLP